MTRYRLKTARALLHRDDEYLLAVHSSFWGRKRKRWGLPGGSIEWRESPEQAAMRELQEELHISVTGMIDLGNFVYKRAHHRVLAAEFHGQIHRYDKYELLKIRWFSASEILMLETEGKLHAGYEADALRALLDVST